MYQSNQTIQVKSRNSFSLVANYSDDKGQPLSIINIEIDAQIRKKYGQLVTVMQINRKDEENGVFEMRLPDDVVLPIEPLFLDVRFIQSGVVVNTDILQLNVNEVVTHG